MLSLIFNGNLKKKLEQRNISANEFYLFERNLTKWLSNNTKNLNYEEMKYFKNASLATFSSGVFTGLLTKFLLTKYKLIDNKLSRNILSVFTGLYTSTFTINAMRKNIYLKLLDSNGPAGYASRNILKNTKEINLNYLNNFGEIIPNTNNNNSYPTLESTNFSPNTTTNVNYSPLERSKDSDKFSENDVNNTVNTYEAKKEENSLSGDNQNFKTWDDIRNLYK